MGLSYQSKALKRRRQIILALPTLKCWFWWTLCSAGSLILSWEIFIEYSENNPMSILNLQDPPEKPDAVAVKICHPVFVDPEKILKSNGSLFSNDFYQFLREVITGGNSYQIHECMVTSSQKDYFMLSSRVIEEFKLDLEKYMIGCVAANYNNSCISKFSWYLDRDGLCYKAVFDLGGYGSHYALVL